MSVLFSDPFVIERSTFTENVAGTDGGGLRAGSARIIVKSSTFQGNEGVLGGGIVANDQPTGRKRLRCRPAVVDDLSEQLGERRRHRRR